MAQNLEKDNFGIARLLELERITKDDVKKISSQQELYKDGLALLNGPGRGVGIPLMNCIARGDLTLEGALELVGKPGFGMLTRDVDPNGNGLPGHGSFTSAVHKDEQLLVKLSKLSDDTLVNVAQQIKSDSKLNDNFYSDIGDKARARLRNIIMDAPEQPGGQGNPPVVPPTPSTPRPSQPSQIVPPGAAPSSPEEELFQREFLSSLQRKGKDGLPKEPIKAFDHAAARLTDAVEKRSGEDVAAKIFSEINDPKGKWLPIAIKAMQDLNIHLNPEQSLEVETSVVAQRDLTRAVQSRAEQKQVPSVQKEQVAPPPQPQQEPRKFFDFFNRKTPQTPEKTPQQLYEEQAKLGPPVQPGSGERPAPSSSPREAQQKAQEQKKENDTGRWKQ